ncbi:hypothetical protein C5Y96_01965 [Blastopirellula marina]|uniref:Uncharacterized protein n=1 Tax=Blastopirellula marina TaxID=124 RepID=A0A2S8G2M5_9BACT|nr:MULTISPECIES: hypothetical protein [Pirellulaceae]PQO38673.1 hypothetical protein C5Y96_01965 [Blastopirellula marina]RCS54981.1 hypothetical protein DTL36_01970 [Bremerella cremea]
MSHEHEIPERLTREWLEQATTAQVIACIKRRHQQMRDRLQEKQQKIERLRQELATIQTASIELPPIESIPGCHAQVRLGVQTRYPPATVNQRDGYHAHVRVGMPTRYPPTTGHRCDSFRFPRHAQADLDVAPGFLGFGPLKRRAKPRALLRPPIRRATRGRPRDPCAILGSSARRNRTDAREPP